jgi:hypothetical protein
VCPPLPLATSTVNQVLFEVAVTVSKSVCSTPFTFIFETIIAFGYCVYVAVRVAVVVLNSIE